MHIITPLFSFQMSMSTALNWAIYHRFPAVVEDVMVTNVVQSLCGFDAVVLVSKKETPVARPLAS